MLKLRRIMVHKICKSSGPSRRGAGGRDGTDRRTGLIYILFYLRDRAGVGGFLYICFHLRAEAGGFIYVLCFLFLEGTSLPTSNLRLLKAFLGIFGAPPSLTPGCSETHIKTMHIQQVPIV